jgi:hypothetical protein
VGRDRQQWQRNSCTEFTLCTRAALTFFVLFFAADENSPKQYLNRDLQPMQLVPSCELSQSCEEQNYTIQLAQNID